MYSTLAWKYLRRGKNGQVLSTSEFFDPTGHSASVDHNLQISRTRGRRVNWKLMPKLGNL